MLMSDEQYIALRRAVKEQEADARMKRLMPRKMDLPKKLVVMANPSNRPLVEFLPIRPKAM